MRCSRRESGPVSVPVTSRCGRLASRADRTLIVNDGSSAIVRLSIENKKNSSVAVEWDSLAAEGLITISDEAALGELSKECRVTVGSGRRLVIPLAGVAG
jgi:hypothetical protein